MNKASWQPTSDKIQAALNIARDGQPHQAISICSAVITTPNFESLDIWLKIKAYNIRAYAYEKVADRENAVKDYLAILGLDTTKML